MSRAGYSDDLDQWQLIKWRGQVTSAIRGQRGQKLLTEMLEALDAMEDKALIAGDLVTPEGDVCALGALGVKRGIDMTEMDPEEPEQVATAFDIAEQLAREIVYMNDEGWYGETPQQRWERMRAWVAAQIRKPGPSPANT
jgi:hypothetical protein